MLLTTPPAPGYNIIVTVTIVFKTRLIFIIVFAIIIAVVVIITMRNVLGVARSAAEFAQECCYRILKRPPNAKLVVRRRRRRRRRLRSASVPLITIYYRFAAAVPILACTYEVRQ